MPEQPYMLEALNQTAPQQSWADMVRIIASTLLVAEYSKINYEACGAADEFEFYASDRQVNLAKIHKLIAESGSLW